MPTSYFTSKSHKIQNSPLPEKVPPWVLVAFVDDASDIAAVEYPYFPGSALVPAESGSMRKGFAQMSLEFLQPELKVEDELSCNEKFFSKRYFVKDQAFYGWQKEPFAVRASRYGHFWNAFQLTDVNIAVQHGKLQQSISGRSDDLYD